MGSVVEFAVLVTLTSNHTDTRCIQAPPAQFTGTFQAQDSGVADRLPLYLLPYFFIAFPILYIYTYIYIHYIYII